MKQSIKFIAAAFAIVAAASCQKEAFVESSFETVTISAELAGTKASVTTDGKVFWQEGDSIAVWAGGAKTIFKLTEGAGTATAKFVGTIAEGATITSAISPAALAGATENAYTVPTTQTVEEGEFVDPEATVMTATFADGKLSFTNPCGIVTITVPTAGLTTAALKSGANTIKVSLPGTTGTFGFVLPAGEYAGVTASIGGTLSGVTGHVFKSSTNTLKVEAGKITSLGNISALSPDAFVTNTISTATQLVTWAKYADLYAAGETITVNADIDLSVLNGGANYKWTPVSFAGNFVGANETAPYVIKGYEVKASDQTYAGDDYMYLGFFGYLSGGLENLQFGTKDGNDAVVTVDDNAGIGTSYHLNAGGVVGRCKYGWIKNVTSYANVTYTAMTNKIKFRIGGVCAHFQSAPLAESNITHAVYNCKFGGNITISGQIGANTSYAGGILGFSQATIHIRNCVNVGTIKDTKGQNYQLDLGGVIGCLGSSSTGNSAILSNCKNGESIAAKADTLVAISLGGAYSSSTSYKYLGGIAGQFYAKMDHCINYASIKVYDAATNADNTWEGGYNKGKSSPRTGGICGYMVTTGTPTITNCANFGTIYNGYVNDTRCNQANIIGYGQCFNTNGVRNCLCAGNVITAGAAWARTGVVVGCQAEESKKAYVTTYGTETEPIYVLSGITLTNPSGTVTIDSSNLATYLQGTGSGTTNVFNTKMVESVDEGLAKLVDTYAE